MPARPTLRQIEYFLGVAEAMSFRRAASRLDVSQPTLTHQVLALEEALGIEVFERSRSGTTLTPAGRELLPHARRALEEVQGLVDQAMALSSEPGGTYRLGVTATLGPYLLPHVLPTIHRDHASLRLYVREDAPRDLERGLVSGAYDLILTPLPVDERGLTVSPLLREPLKLVISSEHRLARKKRIGRRDLAGESVLTIEEHHAFHQQIKELCHRLGARVLRDYEGTSLDTLRQMVVMGMGVAFLPALYIRSEIHRPSELRVSKVHGAEIHRTHALAWRRSSPAGQLFRELAREIRRLIESRLSREVTPLPPARTGKGPSRG
ncbi:MAG TPA: hydrogen peroxide-inducible genes activator [Deltaproteobacteria bacterium]|nr:hydrogen peroxide-inducible genes activator [Deltaproteobacteria bacterium]